LRRYETATSSAAHGIRGARRRMCRRARYQRPQAPANAGYAPVELPQTSASAPIPGGEAQHLVSGLDIPFNWWEQFRSPALNALVERAFEHNPTVASAQAALVQAQELVYAQRGYFFPAVGANYSFARTKIAAILRSTILLASRATATTSTRPCLTCSTRLIRRRCSTTSHGRTHGGVRTGCVLALIRARWNPWLPRPRRSASRWEATYITLASNVVAAAIQEASLRAQIAATQEVIGADEKCCRFCATNCAWVSQCASMLTHRRPRSLKPKRPCRRFRNSLSRPVI